MSFLNGLGLSSLVSQFQIDKPVRDLRDIQASLGPNGTFRTTARHKTQLANIEAQNEDNTTFLFEYRAFLNSQLTTIITKLTNALTSDLDAIMSVGHWQSSYGPIAKPNMQGDTGVDNSGKVIDPGAGRVTWVFLRSFDNGIRVSNNDGASWSATYMDQAAYQPNTDPANGYSRKIYTRTAQPNASAAPTGPGDINANYAGGTISIMTYGNAGTGAAATPDDFLRVYYQDTARNRYANTKAANSLFNITDTVAIAGQAANKFEEVLHKESRTRVFRDIINAGLFRDVIISASTSSATGSQVQASIKLDASRYEVETVAGQTYKIALVDAYINRFTAFYHT